MTEALIVLSTAVAALLLVDPFFAGGLTKVAFAKGIVFAMGFGSLGFHCLGRAVASPDRFFAAMHEVAAKWWPLLLLAAFVVSGSLYGRFADDVNESFLNVGLGMLFMPAFALAVRSSDNPVLFMKWLAAVYLLMVAGTLPILVAGIQLFHESIFLVVPSGVYLMLSRRFSIWRFSLGLALVGVCLFSFKNTTFLIVLTSLFACMLVWLYRVAKIEDRLAVIVGAFVVVPLMAAGAAGAAYAWWRHRQLLPSGNVEYREEMYGIAWRAFLDSPLWGSSFTDASVVHFRLYQVTSGTQFLPTHSDLLDLLAHGGAIAVVLWLLVAWRLLNMVWFSGRTLALRDTALDLRPFQWLGVLSLIQVGAMLTYAINPVMISPVYAFWMWGSAGVMWALYQELTAPPLPMKTSRQTLLKQQVLAR